MAGRAGAGEAAGARALGAEPRGGAPLAERDARDQVADGKPAVRRRVAPDRVPQTQGQGRRLRLSPDPGAQREGREGPGHDAARIQHRAAEAAARIGESHARSRPGRRLRRRGASRCPCAQVSARAVPVGLEVCVSFAQAFHRSTHRRDPPAPYVRELSCACGEGGRAGGRHREARYLPPCATRLPRICWKVATTSGPCRSCSAIRTSRRP